MNCFGFKLYIGYTKAIVGRGVPFLKAKIRYIMFRYVQFWIVLQPAESHPGRPSD